MNPIANEDETLLAICHKADSDRLAKDKRYQMLFNENYGFRPGALPPDPTDAQKRIWSNHRPWV